MCLHMIQLNTVFSVDKIICRALIFFQNISWVDSFVALMQPEQNN